LDLDFKNIYQQFLKEIEKQIEEIRSLEIWGEFKWLK
jgi:hypothetical protein